MHLLRLLLMAWLSLGLVSVLFLFWLCKRTAAMIGDPGKFFPSRRAEIQADNRAA
jgi:hypothetical protein